MSLFDEPDNEVYRLTKNGTLALLAVVNNADMKGAAALASEEKACDAVVAYLDASFLGPFLRSGKEVPYAANVGVLGTFIDLLDHELAGGALHTTSEHQARLKLLAYVMAIEATAPLSLFGNCLEFLAKTRTVFDFSIYYELPSANKKLEAVSGLLKQVTAPRQFKELHQSLRKLVDPVFRNAIAHATYHVQDERVEIWNKGKLVQSRTFQQVDDVYRDARSYQQGFIAGVSEFTEAIHPDCPYAWHP